MAENAVAGCSARGRAGLFGRVRRVDVSPRTGAKKSATWTASETPACSLVLRKLGRVLTDGSVPRWMGVLKTGTRPALRQRVCPGW